MLPRRSKRHKPADAFNLAALPRDIVANVLLRLPAKDLRRLRRVCKEWRDVISDPAFINDHMEHGPWAVTHTIVFLRGGSGADGNGFLFGEDWRLVARFTVSESHEMVGTCNGLLCFLDVRQSAINIVEPYTGESLALPLPRKTKRLHEYGAYCFGFDPSSRRYKIFHLGVNIQWDNTPEQDLYVYTIGGGEDWRRVHITATTDASVSYSDPVFADGSLYWSVHIDRQPAKLARFTLATEEITSMPILEFLPMDGRGTAFDPITDSNAQIGLMTVGRRGERGMFFMGEGGRWTRNCGSGVWLPQGLNFAWPQAVQRGHVLLESRQEASMYVHPIKPTYQDLGSGKLLMKIVKKKDREPAKSNMRGLFVPVVLNKVPEMVGGVQHKWSTTAATFCYALPISPAPLAQRRWFPSTSW